MHKEIGDEPRTFFSFLVSSLTVTTSKDSVTQQLGLDSPNC